MCASRIAHDEFAAEPNVDATSKLQRVSALRPSPQPSPRGRGRLLEW